VKLWRQNRTLSRVRGFLFISLACSVFLWGLQYKLSLYDPPQSPSHHIPNAKLLSSNEQSNASEKAASTQSRPSIKVLRTLSNAVFILLTACVFCVRGSGHLEFRRNPSLQLQKALLEAFFVRPPPSLT
jgi:hypothetical protein